MKKILFFISLLFAVICYAAPPPGLVPDPVTDQCGFVVQVQDNQNVTVYNFDVQEVAFNYLGNFEMASYQEYMFNPVAKLEFPVMVMNENYFAFAQELNKPPSLLSDGLINNRNYLRNTHYCYCENKQNSNYGYPFTGN